MATLNAVLFNPANQIASPVSASWSATASIATSSSYSATASIALMSGITVPVYGTISASFSPSQSLGGGSCILWLKSNTGAYHDANAQVSASTHGQMVRYWQDQTSLHRDIFATGGTFSRVTYNTNGGPNGTLPFIYTDLAGSNVWISAAFGATAVPLYVIAAARSTSVCALIDGTNSSQRILCTYGSGGGSQIYAGASLVGPASSSFNNQWVILSFKSNGASSVIRYNGSQVAAGNSGGQSIVGYSIFSDYAGNGNGGMSVLEMVVCQGISDTDMVNIENYMMARYKIATYANT